MESRQRSRAVAWNPKVNKQIVVTHEIHDTLMKLCVIRGLNMKELITDLINDTDEVEYGEIDKMETE